MADDIASPLVEVVMRHYAFAGALVPKERWERFDLAPRTGMDPRRRRVELGISFAY
jgi:hypothetical protein